MRILGKSADAAQALSEAFFRCAPITKKKPATEAEWAAALQKFHNEAKAVRQRYSLGPINRATAAYQFQKRLLAAGIEPKVVRQVVFSLVLNAFIPGA